jgi:hypothetical protein
VTVLVLELLTMLAAFCSVSSPLMSNAPALQLVAVSQSNVLLLPETLTWP